MQLNLFLYQKKKYIEQMMGYSENIELYWKDYVSPHEGLFYNVSRINVNIYYLSISVNHIFVSFSAII